ncbi:MAG: hypothetical protein JW957_05495 [Candidatus Omnitrophica bacterium]|nr:hypothetical protein [Candidatus Omnitrophota bacterium]
MTPKNRGALVSCFLFILLGTVCLYIHGEPLKTKSFTYTQDFETENPFSLWTSNAEYTVNFAGLTEEKAFAGKKSFKIDAVIQKGSYIYWKIPLKVPAEKTLNLSARLLLGEDNTCRVGLGGNFTFPPTKYSGCNAPKYFTTTGNDWEHIEFDMGSYGRNYNKGTGGLVNRYIWGVSGEDFGTYADSIAVFVSGKPGDRVVLYIDELAVKGEIPFEEDYQKEINLRWKKAQQRLRDKLAGWKTALDVMEQSLDSLAGLSPDAENIKAGAKQKVSSFKNRVAVVEKRDYLTPEEKNLEAEIEEFKAGFPGIKDTIKTVNSGNSSDKGFVLHVIPPISGVKILPYDITIPGELSDTVCLIACPGEYEPGSFVMQSFRELAEVKAKPSALKSKKGSIPADSIDIKIVKCWYQADSAWNHIYPKNMKNKVLVPELLLNDSSLVKVDCEKQENYLKLSFPEEEDYRWISNPEEKTSAFIEDFPVKESPVLLPVTIPAQSNQQFWITLKVPENAASGIYNGTIALSSVGEQIGSVKLYVRILPFRLEARAFPVQSLYYRGIFRGDGRGTVSSEAKTEEQFRAELRNMSAHGIINPTVYNHSTNRDIYEKILKIRQEEGLAGQPIYLAENIGYDTMPEKLQALKKRVSDAIELAKKYGVTDVYIMGRDEAHGERLTAQRQAWTAAREAGGKVWCAGFAENFKLMGDIQDLLNRSGYPDKGLAEEAHLVGGRQICSYGNPFAGFENPELHRRNYGLLLWKMGYDGIFNYVYQHSSGNNGWNDFDDAKMRDLNYTYSTVNGVIDTLAWEGLREGIDDVRYVKTLEKVIEKGLKSSSASIRSFSVEAEDYLKNLDAEHRNLDTIRLEVIDYILKIEGEK